ncbi:hypothetical protein [Flavobacterium phragmitis]|uniref:Uncharacterized protein n=1 Tax=Flavobacterium phragmitis TaxID=739143 RepID=A0A1I1KC17_9FLAO|nr:hypothetical protein [Flavobacterium phragmitis]SFC55623.1 hypothetical protein SAMN05216297_101242 [Flavobacterium phragmitis]
MIDLKRRNFIKNVGFVGASTLFCGSLVAQNTLENFSIPENQEKNILSKFSKVTFFDAFLLDQSLADCYKKSIASWEKTGYTASGNFCYSSSDGLLKMFPMHLHTETTGKVDDVLLCFGKNSKGEWKSLRSLSGFDLEAITVAMSDLNIYSNDVNLSHYLFPAPSQQLNPYSFDTRKGSVSLQTVLNSEQTTTKIIIKEGNNIVYQKEVISQHSLVVSSFFV